jgi:hypothetical protein
MSRPWLVACLGAVIIAGCGGASSTAPTPLRPLRPLALQPGPHWLHFLGFAFSTDPTFPPCENAILLRSGTSVHTRVEVAKAGDAWVGRSPGESGDDIEMVFRESAAEIGGVPQVPGEQAPAGVRATLRGASGGSAELEGTGGFANTFLQGTISGDIRFGDGTFAARCSVVLWSLQRDPSGGA